MVHPRQPFTASIYAQCTPKRLPVSQLVMELTKLLANLVLLRL